MKKLTFTISCHKNIMFGKWCIDGTRVLASLIIDYLDKGWTPSELFTKNYPHIKDKFKANSGGHLNKCKQKKGEKC